MGLFSFSKNTSGQDRDRPAERPGWDDEDLGEDDFSYLPDDERPQYHDPYAPPAMEPFDAPRRSWWRRFFTWPVRKRGWVVRGVAVGLFFLILCIGWLAVTAPLSKSLEPIAPPQVTLLASDGTPIARSGALVDEPVVVADLPDHVIQPFLAIEDRRFYDHWGVDPRGIARAAWTGVGGGSTITQQLAKFTFLTPEQTITRKAQEALIAFWLEAWLDKDEILSRYLSNAYFGDNTYGLRAASMHYFYRRPEKLLPEQAAMLAGLLQAPSRLAPTRNPDLAAKRYALVKQSMVAAGYITQEKADGMRVPAVDVRTRNDLPTGTYFADWAMPEARALAGGGYQRQELTTTLDARLQGIARRVVAGAPLGGAQVALVAMRPNGEVVAMIGGKDYSKSPFNRATQAQRQPGSTFKTFVYLAAIRDGWGPGDTIDNTEITGGSYRPKNARGRYSPTITLEDAFAQSSNVAAVRLYQQVGSEKVIETARELGIEAEIAEGDPSVALGTATMSLVDLTAAYAGIAGNRFPVRPHAFSQPEDGWWARMWNGETSLWGGEHNAIEQLLRAAVNRGTGQAAMLSIANYGKTGTTQDNRDAVFVGYAGEGENRLVVGIWIGNDDNSPLKGVSGGGLPARLWKQFMAQALGASAARPAEAPRRIRVTEPEDEVQVDVGEDGVTIGTDVGDVPVDIIIDGDGVRIGGTPPAAPEQPPQPQPAPAN
ncbi:transglycosylase domain-containing protein [Paraurantiacibacter namhicola]|uniref:peptidoglycan glycosyltransferase n=1 Tax=Paraurantiacibacter namhicola TaxID=645517 RepID=A0A1C7D7P0_9SPHN|nr:transglycosylase domain-containing protein [Paraurantiacibacter namhicola]ANU07465.1 Penicillin-binding protein 2D [Paraurantiacibacter namhicola]